MKILIFCIIFLYALPATAQVVVPGQRVGAFENMVWRVDNTWLYSVTNYHPGGALTIELGSNHHLTYPPLLPGTDTRRHRSPAILLAPAYQPAPIFRAPLLTAPAFKCQPLLKVAP
jgi:hypothetical protein